MKPGDVLAERFEIQRIAASGGMGDVYRGFDRETSTLVAIKSVRSAASEAERRFEREAEILSGLRHPGIVSYLGHGRAEDELYLVMEWLEGEDLGAHLAVRDLSVGESIAVAAQIAAALAFLHGRGVVHRDIKPSNVFLVDYRPDRVKLLDFGVARRAGIAVLTATGVLLGTPTYMAPEQARGRKTIDARADVYALGAVMFRCLTGRPPFEGESIEQVIARLLQEVPPRVRELAPDVPLALDALVARMLAKEPARRPLDGAAVSEALLGLDATAVASPAVTPSVTEPALVGRSEEQAMIRRTLDDCDRGTLLLFTGEPGIGKTRLLHEAAAEVLARGGVVAFGRAFEAEMIRPYGAWIDALRSRPLGALSEALRADLAPLLPELGGPADALDRVRLFDAVVRLLAGLAEDAPVALILDDLQWFDEASAALLHFVVRALDGRRVLVASAARPAELDDNRPVARVVRELGRDRRLVALPLPPLNATETAALVQGEGVDAAQVFADSEGNPLFALEMARVRQRGESGTVAGSLADLLDDHLARVEHAARELLPWAAALGGSFDLETLARVTGQPLAALVAAAHTLERRGIVRVSVAVGSEAHYDFAHDLLRKAAYRQLSEPRRRMVHLQIARVLATPELQDSMAGDVAHHAGIGGDAALSVRAAVVAGERCLRILANAEAAALGERALAVLPHVSRPAAIPLEIAIYDILSRSGRWSRRTVEIETAVSRAVTEAREAGLLEAAQRGLDVIAITQYYGHNFERSYEIAMQLAEPSEDTTAATRAFALAASGRCLLQLERDIPRAEGILLEAQALAVQAKVSPIDVPLGLGTLAYFRGHGRAAEMALVEAWRQADRTQDHWRACMALEYLVRIELERRRPERALERCTAIAPVAARMGEGSEAPFAAALEGLARHLGAEADAEAVLGPAIAQLTKLDSKHQLAYVLNAAAVTDIERDDLHQAQARAERARDFAEAVTSKEAIFARALLARLELARGEREAAVRSVRELLDEIDGDSIPTRTVSAILRIADDLGVARPDRYRAMEAQPWLD